MLSGEVINFGCLLHLFKHFAYAAQSDLVPASTTTNKVQRLKAVDAEGNISNITLYTCGALPFT